MSEYQYYEFQAVDRPLTKEQMAELRALTTRATITPTRLVNVYHYGDFRGDPQKLMENYFDAFVYVANWGTNQLMIRLPRRILNAAAALPYEVEDRLTVHQAGDYVVLDFLHTEEGGGYWVEDEGAEGWMPSLLPLRDELANGDTRALYLGWLAGIQNETFAEESEETEEYAEYEREVDHELLEPPVPPGLKQLSASLEALVEFLDIDRDLIAVAAEQSGALRESKVSTAQLERWVQAIPESEKTALLLRLIQDDDRQLGVELRRKFQAEQLAHGREPSTGVESRRTVGQLLKSADEHAKRRKREEAERAAAEKARQEREAAIARARYLDGLVGREDQIWLQAEKLIEERQAKPYDQATQLLVDLRDLAARTGQSGQFRARLGAVRERYATRSALLKRMEKAGLL